MKKFPKRIKHVSGKWMTLEHNRILVSIKGKKTAASELSKFGLEPETIGHPGAAKKDGREMLCLNNTEFATWMRSKDGSAIDREKMEKQVEDKNSPVEWVSPVYRITINDHEDFLSLLPNALLIEMNSDVDTRGLSALLKKYGLIEDKTRSKYLGRLHYCVIKNLSRGASIDLIEKIISEKEQVRDVRFETMPMYAPTAYIPNDPLYPDQWDMEQIVAGGSGQTGWNLEKGDSDVIICILDSGCDLGHPDLTFTPAPSGINLGTMSGDGSPTGNHGTACAGIAAASINNSEGVAGVAGGCTILPVAFQNWTDVEVAAGIRYATDEGARIISMSFGWDPGDPNIIDPAIQYAFDANVVMCVATHNYNSDITYPATNPLVLACGASDQIDNRKTPGSPDGEGWGSNFGPEISVVAPGVLCPTTDRQGNVGYNTSPGAAGNYRMDFNGTSAATPHVAGLAALLISCQNSLTNVEVRALVESTTDKVGAVPYAVDAGHPNGTWNEEMGYGRINVHEALKVINKRCELDFKALLIDQKYIFQDEFHKLRRFKEKERIDELKGRIGYENPEIFDHTIYEKILVRLEHLENVIEKGQPFIRRTERPEVGIEISKRARKR